MNLLSINDLTKADVEKIFAETKRLKKKTDGDELERKTLSLIFEKPSTRTRTSFEVAMTQLGGASIYSSPRDMQLGHGETIADTAKVLSRYVDAIAARLFSHKTLMEIASNATVPVINALTDLEHPCQALADVFTLAERKNNWRKLRLAWVGDGTNVCNSLVLLCKRLGVHFTVSTPKYFKPAYDCRWVENPKEAVRGADVILTDTWVSMGDENEREMRLKMLSPYQVNRELASRAKPNYVFMHCLPAHRGEEVTKDIIDGRHSIVFEEAENRLHVQKALLNLLVNNKI